MISSEAGALSARYCIVNGRAATSKQILDERHRFHPTEQTDLSAARHRTAIIGVHVPTLMRCEPDPEPACGTRILSSPPPVCTVGSIVGLCEPHHVGKADGAVDVASDHNGASGAWVMFG